MKKRVLSLLLALCLLAGMLPLAAGADEPPQDSPLGVVGYRQSAEDAKKALTTADSRWKLSEEEADTIFTAENNGKSNWMWAPLPKYGSAEDVKDFTLELTSDGWSRTVNFKDNVLFSDHPENGGPLVVVWLLEGVTFPEGKVMAQLKGADGNNLGNPQEVQRTDGEQPGPGPGPEGPAYPENLAINKIDYAGDYGKLWLQLTLADRDAEKLPYGFTITPEDKPDEIWGQGVSYYEDGTNGTCALSLETGKGPGDPNFKFCAGEYTVNLYRFNGKHNAEGEPVFSTEEANRLCTANFTLKDEVGSVYVCAGHDAIENFSEFAANGSPLSQIVTTEVSYNPKLIKIKGTIVSAEDYLDLTLHTFRPTGDRTPTPEDWLSGTHIRLIRNENGGYDVAPDEPMEDGHDYYYIDHVNTWLTPQQGDGHRGYELDATGLSNERPEVNATAVEATSTGTGDDVETVLDAINSAGEGKSAVTIANSNQVLKDAAAENITQAAADKAIYELTGYQPVDGLSVNGATGPSNTSIVAKTSLDVDVKSANLEGENKSIKLDITPKAQVVAKAQGKDGEQPLAGFEEAKKLEVKSAVDLSIPLPEGFAEDDQKLYIMHKEKVYEGTVADNVVTFTNPDGFSEFEILTEKPAEPVKPPTPSGGNGGGSTTPLAQTTTTATPSVSGTTASASVSTGTANTLVQGAKQSGAGEVVVKVPVSTAGIDTVEVSLPANSVSALGKETKAGLSVETSVADITLPNESLTALGNGASSVTVSATRNSDETTSITVKKDDTIVNALSQPMKAAIPAEGATSNTVAVLVDDKGNETIIPKSISGDSKMKLLLTGSAKIKLLTLEKAFDDTQGHWADNEGAVGFVASRQLFQGTSNTSFSPEQDMTRGMMVTVLHRLESKPQGGSVSFGDVESGAYFADAVAWGVQNKIVEGMGGNQFAPGQSVTREQLATFLYRYANAYGVSPAGRASLAGFGDSSDVSSFAKDAMEWCVHAGFIKGQGNGVLNPGGNASRAEVAAILMRFVEYINK